LLTETAAHLMGLKPTTSTLRVQITGKCANVPGSNINIRSICSCLYVMSKCYVAIVSPLMEGPQTESELS